MAWVFRWLLRMALLLMGAVFFVSLLAAAAVLAVVWGLRLGWARLTGRPVAPFVWRVDPRNGFAGMARAAERWGPARRTDTEASRRSGVLPQDVTDVPSRDL
ncbi:hypothetical protein [Acidovorax lacteus]|uniref:Uncharacterized protein n=1 Tax=Acidovorax lacteus TaxID=1924988 RepID=A0ABP8LHH7_9BURK